MGLVRLASRTVLGAADRAIDVAKVIPELAKLGIRPNEVSILAKPDALESAPALPRGKGALAALGKSANWFVEVGAVERAGIGPLIGAGPLASVLTSSPSTSPVGALVMQGVPQANALTYAEQLQAGKILLVVGVADRTMGERVRVCLDRNAVQGLSYHAGRPYGTAFHGTGPGLR